MSKRNLQSLLDKIVAESSKKEGYRDVSDTFTHTYEVNLDELIQEIVDQISGTYVSSASSIKYSLDTSQLNIISKHCITYFNEVKTSLNSTRFFDIQFISASPRHFIVEISGTKKGYNVFGYINKIRSASLEKLRKSLLTELNNSIKETGTLNERILGNYNPKTGQRSGGLLQLGHLQGVSVAEQRASRYLTSLDVKVNNIIKKGEATDTHPLIKLYSTIRSSPTLADIKSGKVTAVVVKEQGQKSNQSQSVKERKIITFIRKEIETSLSDQDWANFKTSPSATEIVLARLNSAAKKAGADKYDKRSTRILSQASAIADASASMSGKTTTSSSKDSTKVSAKRPKSTQVSSRKETINWNSLIGIINKKLPQQVANNMGRPGLVYRTGRFANSTKVVNVETTRDGYPSIVYDYQRDPYDVFDRTLGASPWNTPARDPRALVDKSVREIVQEMAIGRFYTRRA